MPSSILRVSRLQPIQLGSPTLLCSYLYISLTVDVYWVNYSSKFVHYSALEPAAQVPVNTYVTHPWVFIDRFTGERMLVKSKPVYMPEPWYTNINTDGKLARIEVRIHFPLRSLKDVCAWKIFSTLRDKQSFIDLELPRVLVDDLRACYNLFLMNNKLVK
ncbi:von Hippel-Lindau disease tumor suppressor [Culex quinquefasciatus]|uniref:von Hippel-Lindau disease tumor suppressor n=1 Tax=Culex quinquefasciatus TaxID=7176 RepID=B0WSR5_CULQU|nr:von Hippel-Lindau disease tumor suppressor [Culex quinquefasciatus]|eukprot:XP_001853313.1 von Hippel-Lindau disease tumor suppressor [Culex quinquefasciatus]